MESLTDQVYDEAKKLIDEVEQMGGMSKAIVAGLPKLKIEECAARRQAMIDDGKETIVGPVETLLSNEFISSDRTFISGVNKYKLDKEELIQVLQIDNEQVRKQQILKIENVKKQRNETKVNRFLLVVRRISSSNFLNDFFIDKVKESLEKLRQIARNPSTKENLLEMSIEAARSRCTLGEISQALEDVFSRHVADSRLVSGAYRQTFDDKKNQNELTNVIQRVQVRSTSLFSSIVRLISSSSSSFVL